MSWTTISLGPSLLTSSSERPFSLRRFALAPERVCREPSLPTAERTRRITLRPSHLSALFTFHRSIAASISIVSVALSLGLRRTLGTCPFVLRYLPAAVSRFRCPPPCDGFGARTFLPCSCEQRRSSIPPKRSKDNRKRGKSQSLAPNPRTIDKRQ